MAYEPKAVNLIRYSVPAGKVMHVSEGVCMVVTRIFIVRGTLIINGLLKVGPIWAQ